MGADSGTWRPGGLQGREVFTREEIERALRPHLDGEQARQEAATIAATLRDSAMTGAVLSDDVLAMLSVTSADLAERVALYRAAAKERRREAWLRRERRSRVERRGSQGFAADAAAGGERAGDELEARWRAAAADEEREWFALLESVRLAAERAGAREAGGDARLVRLTDRRRR